MATPKTYQTAQNVHKVNVSVHVYLTAMQKKCNEMKIHSQIEIITVLTFNLFYIKIIKKNRHTRMQVDKVYMCKSLTYIKSFLEHIHNFKSGHSFVSIIFSISIFTLYFNGKHTLLQNIQSLYPGFYIVTTKSNENTYYSAEKYVCMYI